MQQQQQTQLRQRARAGFAHPEIVIVAEPRDQSAAAVMTQHVVPALLLENQRHALATGMPTDDGLTADPVARFEPLYGDVGIDGRIGEQRTLPAGATYSGAQQLQTPRFCRGQHYRCRPAPAAGAKISGAA